MCWKECDKRMCQTSNKTPTHLLHPSPSAGEQPPRPLLAPALLHQRPGLGLCRLGQDAGLLSPKVGQPPGSPCLPLTGQPRWAWHRANVKRPSITQPQLPVGWGAKSNSNVATARLRAYSLCCLQRASCPSSPSTISSSRLGRVSVKTKAPSSVASTWRVSSGTASSRKSSWFPLPSAQTGFW